MTYTEIGVVKDGDEFRAFEWDSDASATGDSLPDALRSLAGVFENHGS